MKKVLSLFLVLGALLFGLAFGQGVYAFDPDTDTYDDLFYEYETYSFSFTTTGSYGLSSDTINGETVQDLYDDGFRAYDLSFNSTNSITVEEQTFNKIWVEVGYDDFDETIFFVKTGLSNSTGESVGVAYFSTTDELEEFGDFTLPADDYDIVIYLRKAIPWTQSYSWGRIRNYGTPTTNVFLRPYYGEERAYLANNPSPASEVAVKSLLAATFNNNNEDVAAQSPYKEFTIALASNQSVLKHVEDVAAVFLDKPDSGTVNVFTIYYWDSEGEIATTTYNWDTASGTNNLYAYFHGGIRQAISTQENFIANVDNLVPLEDFLQYIEAWDDLEGDISDQVIISDDGGYQPDVVGDYVVTFSVTDSEGNESELVANVHVVDIEAPVISGTSTPVTISYNQDFNVAAWVASLTVADNYYTGLTISIQSNSYSSNKTVLGTYSVTVKATDGSGNVGTLTRSITVVDEVGPVFTGMTTISASITENLTVAQIKASLAAIDAKDGNVTASIVVDSDELTGNNQVPGTYTVIFVAEDLVGNQTFHTVTVTITSAPPGVYVIDGSSVRLLPGATLTMEQILGVLGITEGYSELSTNYQVNVPGVYYVTLTYGDELFEFDITVLGVDDPVLPPPMIPVAQTDLSWVIWVVMGLALFAVGGFFFYQKKRK